MFTQQGRKACAVVMLTCAVIGSALAGVVGLSIGAVAGFVAFYVYAYRFG